METLNCVQNVHQNPYFMVYGLASEILSKQTHQLEYDRDVLQALLHEPEY